MIRPSSLQRRQRPRKIPLRDITLRPQFHLPPSLLEHFFIPLKNHALHPRHLAPQPNLVRHPDERRVVPLPRQRLLPVDHSAHAERDQHRGDDRVREGVHRARDAASTPTPRRAPMVLSARARRSRARRRGGRRPRARRRTRSTTRTRTPWASTSRATDRPRRATPDTGDDDDRGRARTRIRPSYMIGQMEYIVCIIKRDHGRFVTRASRIHV